MYLLLPGNIDRTQCIYYYMGTLIRHNVFTIAWDHRPDTTYLLLHGNIDQTLVNFIMESAEF